MGYIIRDSLNVVHQFQSVQDEGISRYKDISSTFIGFTQFNSWKCFFGFLLYAAPLQIYFKSKLKLKTHKQTIHFKIHIQFEMLNLIKHYCVIGIITNRTIYTFIPARKEISYEKLFFGENMKTNTSFIYGIWYIIPKLIQEKQIHFPRSCFWVCNFIYNYCFSDSVQTQNVLLIHNKVNSYFGR